MKLGHVLAAGTIGIIGIVGSAGVATADTTSTPTHHDKQAVCAKATSRLPNLQDRITKVDARISSLQTRLTDAQSKKQAYRTKYLQDRIDCGQHAARASDQRGQPDQQPLSRLDRTTPGDGGGSSLRYLNQMRWYSRLMGWRSSATSAPSNRKLMMASRREHLGAEDREQHHDLQHRAADGDRVAPLLLVGDAEPAGRQRRDRDQSGQHRGGDEAEEQPEDGVDVAEDRGHVRGSAAGTD